MGILFHSFPKQKIISKKSEIKNWIKKIISDNSKKLGNINIIFVNDKDLLEINLKYLNHNYFTDTITFNYNNEDEISGDIYISIERVQENSIKYHCSLRSEILRVIIHGIFHLMGFDDKTKVQKIHMRQIEEEAIRKFPLSEVC